jgi:hypothetical protein
MEAGGAHLPALSVSHIHDGVDAGDPLAELPAPNRAVAVAVAACGRAGYHRQRRAADATTYSLQHSGNRTRLPPAVLPAGTPAALT